MGEDLNQWVQNKLKENGWNTSELSRRSGLNSGTISNVLKGKRSAGAKFYQGMAKAFDVSSLAIERLDREGVEPDDPTSDISLSEMVDLATRMTPEQRRETLKFALYVLRTGQPPSDSDDE